MQLFEPKLDSKNKPSLQQYKQLIIELSEAVNILNQQVEQLKSEIDKLEIKNKDLLLQLSSKQKSIEQLQLRKKSNSQAVTQKNTIINDLKKYSQQIQQSLHQVSDQNQKLKLKLDAQIQKRKYNQRLNQVNTEKIRILQENLQSLMQQNKDFTIQMNKKNNLNEWQIKQLRQFNQELRKKFETLEIERPPQIIERSFEYTYNRAKEFNSREKRSFSTQKKTKRNLSTNNMPKGIKKFKGVNELSPIERQDRYKVYTPCLNNPELNNQLRNLKKQISHQYTLINLKTENYSKQRVSKTLQQLKRKMSKAIEAAEGSEGQSCLGQ